MKDYQKIWESHYGPISFDDIGRKFHIHHKDGNKENSSIENLMCISAQEHYNIHYAQKDYFACHMIAKNHLNLNKDDLLRLAELSGKTHKDTMTVKDKDGNTLRVSNKDERYLSGDLVATTKGFVTARLVATGERIHIPREEFLIRKAEGIVVGNTAGIPLSEDHKKRVGDSQRGVKKKRK